LAHFDNDAGAAMSLLAGMLGTRDQWLRELPRGERDAFRRRLEASLAQEITGELAAIAPVFPEHLAHSLPRLQRYAVDNADGATRLRDITSCLLACAAAGGVPPATLEALDDWRAL